MAYALLCCLLGLMGCNSCGQFFAQPKTQTPKQEVTSSFMLSPARVGENFTYRSQLEISLNSAQHTNLVSHELITIQHEHEKIYLRKKLDETHFFELLNYNDEIFVKNRNGDWRSGHSNKAKYQEVMNDAYNTLAWLINQCGLNNILSSKLKTRYEIHDQALPQEAPLWNLLNTQIADSRINGFIELDTANNKPKKATLKIIVDNKADFLLTINLDMSISAESDNNQIPELPALTDKEGLNVPVNIATRFKSPMAEQDAQQ